MASGVFLMTAGHIHHATAPLHLVPDSSWFRGRWQRLLGQRGHRWASALMAPEHAVGVMQSIHPVIGTSHSWSKGELGFLKAYLFIRFFQHHQFLL